MDPCEGALFRENADKRTSELTHFNLVIRLSTMKQSAIPFLTIFVTSHRSCRFCEPSDLFNSALVKLHGTAEKPFILSQRHSRLLGWLYTSLETSGMSLPAGVVSLVPGEVEHIVHLIHWNLNSRLMPTCGCDRLPSLRVSNARLFF
jgi:hypothetical protein